MSPAGGGWGWIRKDLIKEEVLKDAGYDITKGDRNHSKSLVVTKYKFVMELRYLRNELALTIISGTYI